MTSNVDKKLVDCYWFLQQQCNKGEACEYRHWKGTINNQTNCPKWMEGTCNNHQCNFRHPSGVQQKDRSSVVCYFFTNGGCMKGSSCPYSHSVETEVFPSAEAISQETVNGLQREKEELRRLKEERKKEEQRLDELRAQEEALKAQNNKKKPEKKCK